MSRVNLDDLVTGAEIARRLGLTTSRIHQLRERPDFPTPIGKVGQAIVWRWADVEKWAKQREQKQRKSA